MVAGLGLGFSEIAILAVGAVLAIGVAVAIYLSVGGDKKED